MEGHPLSQHGQNRNTSVKMWQVIMHEGWNVTSERASLFMGGDVRCLDVGTWMVETKCPSLHKLPINVYMISTGPLLSLISYSTTS